MTEAGRERAHTDPESDDPSADRRRGVAGLARAASGERLGGFVYGTIVALSVIVAGAKAFPDGPGHVAALVAVTAGVFWLAHVYAHGIGRAVALNRHLELAELRHVARHEFSIVEAAVPPVGALLVGATGLISPRASFWLAMACGLAVLGAEGIQFARIERLGPAATLAVVAANLGLGLLLVTLKFAITH
jgi:hypothetical protein